MKSARTKPSRRIYTKCAVNPKIVTIQLKLNGSCCVYVECVFYGSYLKLLFPFDPHTLTYVHIHPHAYAHSHKSTPRMKEKPTHIYLILFDVLCIVSAAAAWAWYGPSPYTYFSWISVFSHSFSFLTAILCVSPFFSFSFSLFFYVRQCGVSKMLVLMPF